MKSAYNFAYHYNPDKYRRYENAARSAYYDVIAATCEHFEYNRYTFRLHTKHGMILCVVSEESEYFRVYTICDNTEIYYREQICIDKAA